MYRPAGESDAFVGLPLAWCIDADCALSGATRCPYVNLESARGRTNDSIPTWSQVGEHVAGVMSAVIKHGSGSISPYRRNGLGWLRRRLLQRLGIERIGWARARNPRGALTVESSCPYRPCSPFSKHDNRKGMGSAFGVVGRRTAIRLATAINGSRSGSRSAASGRPSAGTPTVQEGRCATGSRR